MRLFLVGQGKAGKEALTNSHFSGPRHFPFVLRYAPSITKTEEARNNVVLFVEEQSIICNI